MTIMHTTKIVGSSAPSTRRWLALAVLVASTLVAGLMGGGGGAAMAQSSATPTAPGTSNVADPSAGTIAATSGEAGGAAGGGELSVLQLFRKSFDFFTVLLVIGSLAGWTIIIKCLIEIRRANIAPPEPEQIISGLIRSQRWSELRQFTAEDDAFVSRVVSAGLQTRGEGKDAVREAAELAASEECSRWFRKVEPLNVLGNLGPLLGLAGTVWGMILAFSALETSGGQPNPSALSGGIAKALFHTLLGLLLAVPCLTIFGFYRTHIDRLCTRAMVVSAEFVELLPGEVRTRLSEQRPNAAPAMQPLPPLPMPIPLSSPAPNPTAGSPGPASGPSSAPPKR